MNIVNDPRKKRLYALLDSMYELAVKEKLIDYKELKREFNNLYEVIFKEQKGVRGDESFEWDLARNQLDNLFTIKLYFDRGKMTEERYNEMKKEYIRVFKNLIGEIKLYLT